MEGSTRTSALAPVVWGILALSCVIAQDCTLECLNDSTCTFGETSFDNHVSTSSSPFSFHDRKESNNMHCACSNSWTGLHCEVPFSTCGTDASAHKCYNKGVCIPGLVDVYKNEHMFCNCEKAEDALGNKAVGKYCENVSTEKVVNENGDLRDSNASSPVDGRVVCKSDDVINREFCLNSGQCNDKYPEYGGPCLCSAGFHGKHCEYRDNETPVCKKFCQNGGQCRLGLRPDEEEKGRYQFWDPEFSENQATPPEPLLPSDEAVESEEDTQYCWCPEGWEGPNCEIPKTKCGEGHCFNGGKCLTTSRNGQEVHRCDCSGALGTGGYTRYAGRYCQYKATSFCSAGNKNELETQLFCVNGGKCKDDSYEGCDCTGTPFEGFSCEFLPSSVAPASLNVTDAGEPSFDDTTLGRPLYDPPEEIECTLGCNGGVCRLGPKEFDPDYESVIRNTTHLSIKHDEDFMHCVCPPDLTGLYCDVKVNKCENVAGDEHFCLHDGSCIADPDGDGSACDCKSASYSGSNYQSHLSGSEGRFGGDHCEHSIHDICTLGEPAAGQPLSFCVNGGSCLKKVQPGDDHPGCDCGDGFGGPHCELRSEFSDDPDDPMFFDNQADPAPDGGTGVDGSSGVATAPSGTNSGSSQPEGVNFVNTGTTSTDSSPSRGLQVAALSISLIAILVVSLFGLTNYIRRRRRLNTVHKSLQWSMPPSQGRFRDEPDGKNTINLAPRDDGEDEKYMAAIHSSRTDPFTNKSLSPNMAGSNIDTDDDDETRPMNAGMSMDIDSAASSGDGGSVASGGKRMIRSKNSAPQVYIGPPRDEDGHELHSVDII